MWILRKKPSVYLLFKDHDESLDTQRAAAEIGMTSDKMLTLASVGDLGSSLNALTSGNTISRQGWDLAVEKLLCTDVIGGCEKDGCGLAGLSCLDGQTCQSDGTCINQ